MNQHGIKQTLKAGSLVFGASAIFLLIAPELFLDLLDLESNDQLVWSMRMIAITLIALAGNMWQNSNLNNNAAGLKFVARVMFLSAAALGFFTIFIPSSLTPFAIGYAVIGFVFAISYLLNLLKRPN
jgi:O-antigen/teichoic acid export membrane protein